MNTKVATRRPAPKAAGISEQKDPRFAYTLANGLQILEAFTGGAAFLGNRELSDATGMRKATVSRLTRTLCSLGYLKVSATTGKFELGLSVLSLAYPRLITLPIRRVAHLLLQGMADRIHGVVNIGMRDRLDIVFVESCRSVEGLATRREIGARRPIWTGYVGEAYLAGLGERAREALFADITSAKLTDVKALRAAVQVRIKELERNRFCAFSGDGIHAIASTFRASPEGEIAFIFCLVKDSMMPKSKALNELPRQLWDVIGKLEESLGAPVPNY